MPVRRYRSDDASAVADLWFRAGKATYTFLPTWRSLSYAQAQRVFREVIAARCDIWVADRGGVLVGFLALDGSYVDRLYVDPHEQRRGWGTRLLEQAMRQCPRGLELHTHRENVGARAFYEAHGFKAVRFGVSPPPESAPDVEYHWRPATAGPI